METFVTFELAKKLKEKGFDELCLLHYTNEQILVQNSTQSTIGNTIGVDDMLNSYNRFNNGCTDVPTISQVLKWLREYKGVNIITTLWNSGWYVDIQPFTKKEDEEGVAYEVGHIFQSPDYETYEQATLTGIEYVLDNLI